MDQTSHGQTSSSVCPLSVSGTHARLEKKAGSLLVTDLDSTNGTYINERRLNPGFPVPIDPGSLLIFGLDPTIPCNSSIMCATQVALGCEP
jgi:pSer/pThr/pTyr-binding forkhead associated (FHA) protein